MSDPERSAKMKHWKVIVITGGIFLSTSFFLLPQAIEWWFFRSSNERFHRTFVVYPSNRISAFAPVLVWDDRVPKEDAPWQDKGSLVITMRDSELFSDGTKIPRRVVREFVDRSVDQNKTEYVVVIPNNKTSWRDLWIILDDLRQSKATIVFVKHE